MGVLSKDDLKAIANRPPKVKLIDVPEFGEGAQVYIRVMSGTDYNAYQKSMAEIKPGQSSAIPNLADTFAKLAVRVLCDEQGGRIYADTDVSYVGKLPADGLQKIFTEGAAFNRLNRGAVSEEIKNSESSQTN